ncbi:alpha/beta hydrolase-fold protein [Demequina sp. SYSU T00192]|uniref:Alpha/beta hydrolase-fold protein n=1 Tax=Demequina litoralis TaxID=3051660 RepID=A0ABT8GBQ4_9MICO|nr:alpha/beta hydrolase-fold protein [Demequina sp. SYSU T00192]MDN4476563.1 alpha/beta hydrolase-fold protein [Demequina sp. SYSU T00192]
MSLLSRHRRARWAAITAVAAAAGVACASAVSAAPATPAAADRAAKHAPVIKHTGKAPTGYEVTFELYAPDAERVQIKGEWYFARPSELDPYAGTPEDPVVESPGIMPADWQAGDFPLASPNSTNPNWPVVDMVERGNSGVWTYTTPLPGGTFTYAYYVDCETADQSGCTPVADPSNLAWNVGDDGESAGSVVPNSQIYVPADADFDPSDTSWQEPVADGGTLELVTYDSPGHVSPVDENYMVVYTPPGYDAGRAEPYPTLYLSHGGGEDALGWSTQGALAPIMDNLIMSGEVQPMVVVMPNGNGYPASTENEAFRTDLIGTVFPYMEAHYNVSTEAADRAFSGLSAGGMRTNQLMLYNTDAFDYYGMMSAGMPPGTTLSDQQIADLQEASIFVGGGWQDVIHAVGFSIGTRQLHTGPLNEVRLLTDAGIHVSTDFVNGGHNWSVWRTLLRDFTTRVAFLPPTSAPPTS